MLEPLEVKRAYHDCQSRLKSENQNTVNAPNVISLDLQLLYKERIGGITSFTYNRM